jgi:hypothetical protein
MDTRMETSVTVAAIEQGGRYLLVEETHVRGPA